MGSNWTTTTVGDFCPFVYGKAIKKADRVDNGIPVYGSNGAFTFSKEALTPANTIIIGRKGSVGKLHLSKDPCWVGDTAFYVTKETLEEAYFTFYLLSSLGLEFMNTDAAVPGLNRNNAHRLEVKFPSTEEERKNLIKPLMLLDSKIALNTQINETLEAIAQAIFKSWFIDFDPIKAKMNVLEAGGSEKEATLAAMRMISSKSAPELEAFKASSPEQYAKLKETAELFPSEMEEVEVGGEVREIPKGWGVSKIGEVSTCFDRQRIPLSKRERLEKPGTVPYYGATSIMDYVDEAIFEDIYMLIGEDGSVAKEDGTPFLQYIWGPAWVNNHAHVLQGAKGVSTEQLLLFFRKCDISSYITGAVQAKLNQRNMNSIPFILAASTVNDAFNLTIAPFFENIRNRREQNQTLAELRDTLLPRLLSGQIELPVSEDEESAPISD